MTALQRSRPALIAAVIVCFAPIAEAADDDPLFVDATESSGLVFHHFNGMSGNFYFVETMGPGAAVFDYDRDGDMDVYITQSNFIGDQTAADTTLQPRHPLPLTDRLYRNDSERDRDGRITRLRFTDVTDSAGLGSTDAYSIGVAVGDYDGDGWQDLYLTNFGHNVLLRNKGDGSFEDVTVKAGVGDDRWSVPAVFFDLEPDGDLDLYVGNYVAWDLVANKSCRTTTSSQDYCSPKVYAPQADRLFVNQGDGTFVNTTSGAGLTRSFGAALGVVATDFDGDSDIDLFVANDGSANQLWINLGGGRFRDEGPLAGVAYNMDGVAEASMGVDAGDIDGDGDDDLFITHLATETNTLYINDGSGWFEDRTLDLGLASDSLSFTGFGTGLLDFDNDGWLDLFAANGAVTVVAEQLKAGDPFPMRQPNQLFRNLGDGRFVEVTEIAGPAVSVSDVSRGAAFGDLDDDGDTDILVLNNAGDAQLLLNTHDSADDWLGVHLKNARGATLSGARVGLSCGERTLWRRSRREASYASSNDPRVLFGLGDDAPRSCDAEIVWPGGHRQRATDLEPGRYNVVVRSEDR